MNIQLIDIMRLYAYQWNGSVVYHDIVGQTSLSDCWEFPRRLVSTVLKIWAKDDNLHILLDCNFERD